MHFTILSWNVQGKANLTGFTRYKKIKPYIQNSGADIVALQEIHNAKRRLARSTLLQTYRAFIPTRNKRLHNRTPGYNSNVILSKFPIRAAGELIFPEWNDRIHLENCSWAKLKIGNTLLKLYSAHFPVHNAGMATRLLMLRHILEDAQKHAGPVIICGDLNTTSPRVGVKRAIIHTLHRPGKQETIVNGKRIKFDERTLFNETLQDYGFTEVLDLTTPTWSPVKSKGLELFRLKLDWFMVRGLVVEQYQLGDYISDHKSVEVRCAIANNE